MTNVTAAALLLLALAAGACDPTPTFPTPEPPLVGTVLRERELFVSATESFELAIFVGVTRSQVTVPAGAAAPGTRVVLRFVRDAQPAALPAGYEDLAFVTLQVLPVNLQLAMPLTYAVKASLRAGTVADVMSASEQDLAWTRHGPAAPGDSTYGAPTAVIGAIDGPHLWKLAWRTVPAGSDAAVTATDGAAPEAGDAQGQ